VLVRSPRALLLWSAAVVVAVATGGVVASDLATLHRRANDFGPERDALVARHELPVGTTVELGDLRVRRVHASQLPPGVLADRARAAGRVVAVPVLRDAFVSTRNLAPRRRRGLDGALPTGSRAMRVVVSDAIRPRPGASADVLATFGSGNEVVAVDDTSEPTSGEAVVIAEGALVLAVDDARTREGGAGIGVTFLLTPHEARELAFATTHGVVTVALVPPEDAQSP